MTPTHQNAFAYRAHLSEATVRELVALFAIEQPATAIADQMGLSRRTVNRYVLALRHRMAAASEQQAPYVGDELEIDVVEFTPRRIRGPHGPAAIAKTFVVGLFRRGYVYTAVLPDPRTRTLVRVLGDRIARVPDLTPARHFHIADVVARRTRTGPIRDRFWRFVRWRLMQAQGIRAAHLALHLKEYEFRFNFREHEHFRGVLLKLLRDDPLK